MILYCVTEMKLFPIEIGAVHFEADEAAKQKKKETLLGETVPFYLSKLEELASENKGHLAVSKLTWADVFFASMLEVFKVWTGPEVLSQYPNLSKVADNVYNLDAIKAWRTSRPVTDM